MKKRLLLVILLVFSIAYALISVEAAIWRENSDDYPSLAWEGMPFSGNQKDMSLYSGKELFLVSDKNWKDVLPFVSASVWTQQEGDDVECSRGYGTPDDVCVYPMLIWHEEDTGFDIDSSIYFMQQYSPDRVTIIGQTPQELDNLLIVELELGAGLSAGQIQRIGVGSYLDYWSSYEDVVYVEDDYELALLASTYASLINAPLVIEGNEPVGLDLVGRKVVCVGLLSGVSCDEVYNLEGLQQKYVDETNTDKIILVNPEDLDIKVEEEFQPEKSANPVYEIYGGTSLAAPILAGAKKEVMTFVSNPNYLLADQEFTNQFLDLYGFAQSDVSFIGCNYGDFCSSVPEVYKVPTKESINDEVHYTFDIEDVLDYNIQQIFFQVILEESCFKSLNEDIVFTLNDDDFLISSRSLGYGFPYGPEEEYINVYLPLETNEKPLEINIKVPGCKIIRLTDEDYSDEVLHIDYFGGGYLSKDYEFVEETKVQDSQIVIEGLLNVEGNIATFNFENLNLNFDYNIEIIPRLYCGEDYSYECIGPLIEDGYLTNIEGGKIIDGIEISVKPNPRWPYEILPIVGIRLYPQLSEDYYLTIFASPEAIQMSYGSGDWTRQLDSYYKTLDENYDPLNNRRGPKDKNLIRLYGGRIFGISLSDLSSYVARDLFFDKLPKDKSLSSIWRGTSSEDSVEEVIMMKNFDAWWQGEENIYQEFDSVYACYSYDDSEVGCDTYEAETKQSYYDSYFTIYDNHGWYDWAFVDSQDLEGKYLQPKTSFVSACATCSFEVAKDRQDTGSLFCMQNLRRGALGYVGAQSASFQSSDLATRHFMPLLVVRKETIGKSWQIGENKNNYGWNPYYVLIGDPTLKPIYWGESREWDDIY